MRKQFPVSIHLMLLFIAKQLPDGRFSDEFQYISYYSLSITIQNQFGFQYSFNTSHVTLYRLSYRNSYQLHLGFNTSHVTLYLIPVSCTAKNSKFQYISCYSLSEVSAIIAGPITRFNTSHVTLYPSTYRKENGMKLFQYISCYSLSYVNKKDKSIIQMFQYISCYSLSNYTENIMEDKASFNTSHVTLYLRELGIAF